MGYRMPYARDTSPNLLSDDIGGRNDHRRPGLVAITAVRYLVRITGSPRNRAASDTADCRRSPCFSGYSGSCCLPPPATGCQYPAMVRVPAPEHEFGRFQIAYGGLDGRIVGVRTHACQRWRIQEFDVSVDGFPEQGRQVP